MVKTCKKYYLLHCHYTTPAQKMQAGNQEREAERSTMKLIKDMDLPEAEYFIGEFLPSYGLTLDEQNYSTTAGVKVSEDSQMFFSKALE